MHRLSRLFALVGFPVALLVGGMAIVLLVVADTWAGRALGLGFVCASVATVLLPFALWPDVGEPAFATEAEVAEASSRARRVRTARLPVLAPLVAIAVVCLGGAWAYAPDGVDRPALTDAPGLQSIWLGPAEPARAGLPHVTPERDQMVLASHLLWMLDPWLDREEATGLRAAMRAVYAEIDADPSYGEAGSALGLAYDELLGGPDVSGHVYVDRAPGGGTQPAILYLHGWGGSLLAYPWVLRRAAHARGYAIVAPSYGAGYWFDDEGIATVERTLQWMAETGRFDMDRVVLAGLSNGGHGVTAAAPAWRWQGIAWLSGVIEPGEMPEIGAEVRVPILVLHGGQEDRVPIEYATAAVEELRAGGATVDFDVVEDADHFLLFTHRARVDAAIDRWLGASEKNSATFGLTPNVVRE